MVKKKLVKMSNNTEKKPWERPWNTQEMIENASNWNLAGDAGLLKYLEEFSEKMLTTVKDTNDRLNDLIDNAEETSLALNNATNKFMGLRNTQFIESRVYEDDETLPTKQETDKEEKPKPTETERLEEMKKSICNGLEIIDKYYEKVEIPESDSEEDISEPSILYRPVDPYIDRPLPYVIGTDEWHKYWHVGLGHSSSDSEIENEQDQFSESDSEEPAIKNLPIRDQSQIAGISDSESEDMVKTKTSGPAANSTFNDNNTNKNLFDSSSDSETGSLPPQVQTINNNFAEELAAKLGKVETSKIQVEVNTKPIQKASNNITGGLFSDEPPPLDDDIFVNKNVTSGLFSGGSGLFDDLDDDNDFWNTKKPAAPQTNPAASTKPVQDKLFEDEEEIKREKAQDKKENNDNKIFPKSAASSTTNKKSVSLFDDDLNDDDDIFNSISSVDKKKPSFFTAPASKINTPLISEEPPDLEPKSEEIKQKKPPVGGVSVLNPAALLQSKILKNRASSSSDSDETDQEIYKKPAEEIFNKPTENIYNKPIEEINKSTTEVPKIQEEIISEEKPTKKLPSLFDDTSPLFSDDIFSVIGSNKSSSLFEDESPTTDSNLFNKTVESKTDSNLLNKTTSKTVEVKTDSNLLNKTTSKTVEAKTDSNLLNKTTSKTVENKTDSNLFSNEPPPIISETKGNNMKKVSLFDAADDNQNDFEDDLFSSISKNDSSKISKKSSNIFKEYDDDDDLFSSSQVTEKLTHSLFDPTPPVLSDGASSKKASKTMDLFDPNPPDLDESDAKSDSHYSLENDGSSYGSLNAGRVNLFDTEPPLLANESSGIVRDQSTRLESEDSSFFPCMTSSRRHSDFFQDNQTGDSLFTAKSLVSSDQGTKSDLGIISENESLTKIDITPSGNESSLLNNSVFIDKSTEKDQKPPTSFFSDDNNFLKEKPKKSTLLFQDSDSDDDLFSNKSSGSKNSSITSDILSNSSNNKPPPTIKPLKTKNIFEDDSPGNDIFQKKVINKEAEDETDKVSKITDELFEKTQENLNEDSTKFDYDENLRSDNFKTDPKKSISFEKNIEKSPEEIKSPDSSPGKLKHNLNINVAALLPGAAPPRKPSVEKTVNESSPPPENKTPEAVVKSTEKSPEKKENVEKSVSFEAPSVTTDILTSAVKERVKIAVKRRPSTRRARHESIRKSAVDLLIEDPIEENNVSTQNILNISNNNNNNEVVRNDPILSPSTEEDDDFLPISKEKIDNPLLNPLSPSTEEEDFLSMPREKKKSDSFAENSLFGKAVVISPENKQTTDLFSDLTRTTEKSTKTNNVSSIFSSSDSENDLFSTPKSEIKQPIKNNNTILTSPDEDLFKPVTKSQIKPQKKEKSSLFFDDNEEDDIFTTIKPVQPKQITSKKSLFDDDDDDDDIFGGSSNLLTKMTAGTSTSTSSAVIKKSTVSKIKKLPIIESSEDILDPLEALKK